ncbi:MAG: HD domain-containing protein [Desulfobacterales bacterium]|nr:HD domain-containing protein [Desulfobacterales bacterium]
MPILHQVGLKFRWLEKDQTRTLGDNVFSILAVDDDPSILEIYREILESAPARPGASGKGGDPEWPEAASFRTVCRCQAVEAVEEVRRAAARGDSFAAVFLDVNMPPGPSGIWAAEQILHLDPAANIVLVTGYIGSELGRLPRSLGFSDRLLFLQKPFHPQEIVQFGSALSAKWRAERQVQTLNCNLEWLVRQRTEELLKSNELLRCEVERREHAQQELLQSLEQLKKVIGGTVLAIAKTVEKRDPYTSGHQRRVAELARAIGREMGLSPERLEGLAIASAIHDIGKISLPAEILAKPAQLNALEMSMVRGHSQAGFDILQSVEFPWPVARIVLQHHERLNGSGYPQGLSGKGILQEARIVGVADVVETMSSHRPYRPSMGLDKALDEISEKRGVLYDPEAVDACVALIHQHRFEFAPAVFS